MLASLYQTAESHECKGKDSGCRHCDRYALERLGNVRAVLKSGSHSCEDDHGKKETDSCSESVNQCLKIVISKVDVVDANTEYSAVGGDKRKIYTQCLVKGRDEFLQYHLYELYEGCDYEDEYDGLQICDVPCV